MDLTAERHDTVRKLLEKASKSIREEEYDKICQQALCVFQWLVI